MFSEVLLIRSPLRPTDINAESVSIATHKYTEILYIVVKFL